MGMQPNLLHVDEGTLNHLIWFRLYQIDPSPVRLCSSKTLLVLSKSNLNVALCEGTQ